MRVLSTVRVAMEVKVRAVLVRVHVQVPASARVAQHDRRAEPDQEQRDEKVGGGPEAIGKVEAEQHDERHDHSDARSEEHTSELQSPCNLVCRLLLEKKK